MAHIVQINNREVIRLPLGRRQIPPQPPVGSVFPLVETVFPLVETVFPEEQSWSAPSDDGRRSVSSESDDGLLATLLRLDRRSLFTGSTADLEVAYLIPPDSKDASEAAHVEEVCNRLKMGGDDRAFRLHGLMNTFLLESSLRVHLDDLASFCITLPFVEFCSLCDQLQLDNQEWSERAKQDPTAQRILGRHEPRLHSYAIQQLAFYRLSPAFLPDDTAIQILPGECRTLDQPCPNPAPVLQKPAIYDELICEIPYPPSLRAREDKLSPLALLVSAHYKLQTYMARELQPYMAKELQTYMAREHRRRRCFHLEQYCLFLDRFMDLLYFVPPSGPEGARDSSVAGSTGTSLADASDRNRSFDRGDTPADAHETPDEDDLINGLTTEEMGQVIRQVSNPRATDAARVEATMLMFGMAGRARQPDDPFRWL